MTIDEQIKRELEILRGEIDAATQHLYAYLAVHSIAKRRKTVLEAINLQPLFWMTVTGALQTSALITLRRIFDQDSRHNIDALLGLFQKNQILFSKTELAKRKGANELFHPVWLGKYLENAHEPSPADFRNLRKAVKKARDVYEKRFKKLSNKVFAHLELHGPEETALVTKDANIFELKRLLSTLSSIQNTLSNIYFNGHKPVVNKLRFSAKPRTGQEQISQLHERIFHQAEQALIALSESVKGSRENRSIKVPRKAKATSKLTPR
jgi:hypothetical protein